MTNWTPEQQREHRAAWVAALRSGKYAQAKFQLTDGKGGFCCLGVACDVSGLGEWAHDDDRDETASLDYYIGSEHVGAHLPYPVRRWLGLSSKDGDCDGGALSLRNDRGTPFSLIADIIEAEPEGLLADEARAA